MNFLEQLAAEWYEYKGYFVRTNIKFGPRKKGGWIGEMDVVAYNPNTREFLHIETSVDANSWKARKRIFVRKFRNARRYYLKLFPFKSRLLKQIVIVGFNKRQTEINFGDSIEIVHIPTFIQEIADELKVKDPQKNAVPESYPLLRAIQYSAFYNKEKSEK